MTKSIYVYVKDPGKPFRHVVIPNTLESLQKTVGGFIEFKRMGSDWGVICDEDGAISGLQKYNCSFCGIMFCGPIIFAGIKGQDFADFPIKNELEFEKMIGRCML